jgi:hypothetical protein
VELNGTRRARFVFCQAVWPRTQPQGPLKVCALARSTRASALASSPATIIIITPLSAAHKYLYALCIFAAGFCFASTAVIYNNARSLQPIRLLCGNSALSHTHTLKKHHRYGYRGPLFHSILGRMRRHHSHINQNGEVCRVFGFCCVKFTETA